MKNILKTIYFLPLFLMSTPLFADVGNPGGDGFSPPKLSGGSGVSIASLVDKVLGYLFPIAGIIAIIFVIYGGYMWMVSGGDPGRVKQAQGTLTWAVLGLIFVMVILGILKLVVEFVAK